eukprot:TRINITY_DN9623_c0_g1_i1.p1 TRINITY_DN9623_c0_g1~~TRINITY_DN9623_c0_g1_i1.p1  ORF type:complete len:246 (-),score=33.68 TRINITY_DN9623_c0_g1_i1:190-927(-)
MQDACGGLQPRKPLQGGLLESLPCLWRLYGGEIEVQVKNTFIHVACEEESELKRLTRSQSWSGCRSITQDTNIDSSRCSLAGPKSDSSFCFSQESGSSNCFVKASDRTSASDGTSESSTSMVSEVSNADLEKLRAASSGWSEGAGLHNLAKCNLHQQRLSAPGCTLREDGQPCHVMHSNSNDKNSCFRPCKATRNRCKRIIEKIAAQYNDDPASKLRELEILIVKYPYARTYLKDMLPSSNGMET